MKWPRVWVMRGANVWGRCPMLEVELDVEGAADATRATERLRSWVPGFDTTEADDASFVLATTLQRLTLTLQRIAGSPVSAGGVRPAERTGVFRVAVEFEEEALGVACLEAARDLCLAALGGTEPDVAALLARLRELALDVRLGPSTAAIVTAARRRGIPARRLNDGSLVQLGHGARQRRIWTAETDRTSAVAEVIAQDKELTRELLRGVGVPVPEGRPASDAEDAWAAAEEVGVPVVVKPRFGNHGRGVTTNLRTHEQVQRAFAAAREEGEEIVVERFVPGSDYRLLVIGGRLAAAALREPPAVVGDGRSSVSELVEVLNCDPRRSDGHGTALSYVKLDAVALAVLDEQGHTPQSVPGEGERVLIRRNANLSSGGTATDVTDQVHPTVAASAVAAARAVGLDIAGVDVVAPGIERPLEESGGAVVEVNAGPGLRMHLEPSAGTPQPVGDAVVGLLFDEGQSGRIPLIALLGGQGETSRLLTHLLAEAGHVAGTASPDGLNVGGRLIRCEGPTWQRAQALLFNPRVTAGVLEVTRAEVRHEGLGLDVCGVAVIPADESASDEARALVEAAGAAVLDAADPHAAALASNCTGSVVYFANADNGVLRAHRRAGGRAVFLRDGAIVFANGRDEDALPLDEIPALRDADLKWDNALAAIAAAWALDLSMPAIGAGLASLPERATPLAPV